MKITILTLFPEMFDGFSSNSIIKRAIGKQLVEIKIVNIRDYTKDKYGRVDTPIIGGGAGLVLKCQPIISALDQNKGSKSYVIMTSPKGKQYTQEIAKNFAKLEDIIIICGHYEGVDERVSQYVDESISIGDFILTGGEIASMAIADSIIRLLDGAISKSSLDEETFDNNLIEYSQYTEPYCFDGKSVPDILYSGNHKAIEKYRRKESLFLTRKYRPDLFKKINLTKEDLKLLKEIDDNITPKWEKDAIEKGHKFIHKKEN
jgi:tRNA (guanine37-N1)-methyltransferase